VKEERDGRDASGVDGAVAAREGALEEVPLGRSSRRAGDGATGEFAAVAARAGHRKKELWMIFAH